jgi:hypothetical protein
MDNFLPAMLFTHIPRELIHSYIYRINFSICFLFFYQKKTMSDNGDNSNHEQLFSLAGHTVRKTRTRLLPETTRACLYLKSWISNDLGQDNDKNAEGINIDSESLVENDDSLIDWIEFLDE